MGFAILTADERHIKWLMESRPYTEQDEGREASIQEIFGLPDDIEDTVYSRYDLMRKQVMWIVYADAIPVVPDEHRLPRVELVYYRHAPEDGRPAYTTIDRAEVRSGVDWRLLTTLPIEKRVVA